jgi:hypothetical protein
MFRLHNSHHQANVKHGFDTYNVRYEIPYRITIIKHSGMAPIKFIASQAHTINQYKNISTKAIKCCTNIYFNRQCLTKKRLFQIMPI